jgi:hypothetical protein
VYSLNVPLSPDVRAHVERLEPLLEPFDWIREDHSLLLKRVGDGSPGDLAEGTPTTESAPTPANGDPVAIVKRVRESLGSAPAFECRLDGVGVFEDPPAGSAPVVYLRAEGEPLYRLHRQLCETFPPVPVLEGQDYDPHVTLARGGPDHAVARLKKRRIEPITWTVGSLELYDGDRRLVVEEIDLPL